MPKTALAVKSYSTLVKNIQSELQELDFFVRRRTAEAYWRTGKFIQQHLLENKQRADYGRKLFNQLERDVSRDKSTLQRAVQFYRTYPIIADQRQLSWDHYKRLITIPDKDKRQAFERLAVKREWTAEELQEAIRLDRIKIEEPRHKSFGGQAEKLSVLRARLFTYKILEPEYIHAKDEDVVVDVGFYINTQVALKGIARPKDGQIVESTQTVSGYTFKASDAKPKELYTYKAQVERVVDGDTLWANIDCGFDIWIRQKLRLRGIDTPELGTLKGKEAKQFVEAKLKGVDFVVIKTHAPDKYDRYLSDVFYKEGESRPEVVLRDGEFLNQELLDRGLAKVV